MRGGAQWQNESACFATRAIRAHFAAVSAYVESVGRSMAEKPGSRLYLTFTVYNLKKQLSLIIFVNASFSNFWGEMMGVCFLLPSLITRFRHENVRCWVLKFLPRELLLTSFDPFWAYNSISVISLDLDMWYLTFLHHI